MAAHGSTESKLCMYVVCMLLYVGNKYQQALSIKLLIMNDKMIHQLTCAMPSNLERR